MAPRGCWWLQTVADNIRISKKISEKLTKKIRSGCMLLSKMWIMFNWSNFKKKKQRHLCLCHFSSLSLFYFYHYCFNHQELPIILIKLFRDKDETVGRSRVCDVHKRARGKQRGAQHPPHAPPHHDQPPPLPPHHRHHQVRLWAELWRSSRRELPVK